MKILSAEQIREADRFTIKNEPITSVDLMERASIVFTNWFSKKFDKEQPVKIFSGIGNNGGDGLAVGRLLHQQGYSVSIYIIRYGQNPSDDFLVNEERLLKSKIAISNLISANDFPQIAPKDIVIDALWGSGLSRPIVGFAAELIKHLNESNAIRVAIDIPSGLYTDKKSDSVKFKADYTLSFEVPKLSFMFPENLEFVGQWKTTSIGLDKNYLSNVNSNNHYFTIEDARQIIKPRKKYDHKGTFGHALIIAGSYGKIGAAVLSARACLRTGAGLVNAFIPKCGYEILQSSIPEAMVITSEQNHFIDSHIDLISYNAIGIGPGIGTQDEIAQSFLEIIKKANSPLVLDADALNILSNNIAWLKEIPKSSILTPHPKEFQRLFGATSNNYDRHQLQLEMAKTHNIYIVLKGAHTAITCPDGNTYFNSTGNPGMATAGSGDVLTGIITGLLAQGYSSKDSAILGVFLHGLAGDYAAKRHGQYTMIASDIIKHLDKAFKKIMR